MALSHAESQAGHTSPTRRRSPPSSFIQFRFEANNQSSTHARGPAVESVQSYSHSSPCAALFASVHKTIEVAPQASTRRTLPRRCEMAWSHASGVQVNSRHSRTPSTVTAVAARQKACRLVEVAQERAQLRLPISLEGSSNSWRWHARQRINVIQQRPGLRRCSGRGIKKYAHVDVRIGSCWVALRFRRSVAGSALCRPVDQVVTAVTCAHLFRFHMCWMALTQPLYFSASAQLILAFSSWLLWTGGEDLEDGLLGEVTFDAHVGGEVAKVEWVSTCNLDAETSRR
eukprot:3548093-Rhodomonas_salina.1